MIFNIPSWKRNEIFIYINKDNVIHPGEKCLPLTKLYEKAIKQQPTYTNLSREKHVINILLAAAQIYIINNINGNYLGMFW